MSDLPQKHGDGLAALGVTLALGLIGSAYLVAHSFERVKLSKTIVVKGVAERGITSDLAVWRGSFQARDAKLTGAYDKLQGDLDKVSAFLEQRGVKRQQIDVTAIGTTMQYKTTTNGVPTNEIEGYVLGQSVQITSTDIALIAKLSRESTALIKDGIEFSSSSPEYLYTKLNDLKIEMLGAATKDARLRADQLARNSGSGVGALRSAQQGIFQVTPVNSTDVSDSGVNDTSSIEKKIRAVVTIEYSIR